MSMIQEIADLVFRPVSFFARVNREPPDYSLPFLFAGSQAVIILLFFMVFLPAPALLHLPVLLLAVATSLLIPLLEWTFISVALYVYCRAFSGRGSFGETFYNTGFSLLPVALVTFLNLLVTLLVVHFKIAVSSTTLFWGLFAVVCIIYLVLILWTAYLWMPAMETAHDLPHRNARSAAIVTGFLYLIWCMAGWISFLIQ